MQQMQQLQEDAGIDIPTNELREVDTDSQPQEEEGQKADSIADTVVQKVVKAGEAVQDAVGKAGSFLKEKLGSFTGENGKKKTGGEL